MSGDDMFRLTGGLLVISQHAGNLGEDSLHMLRL